jgi:hypothetical protein
MHNYPLSSNMKGIASSQGGQATVPMHLKTPYHTDNSGGAVALFALSVGIQDIT